MVPYCTRRCVYTTRLMLDLLLHLLNHGCFDLQVIFILLHLHVVCSLDQRPACFHCAQFLHKSHLPRHRLLKVIFQLVGFKLDVDEL